MKINPQTKLCAFVAHPAHHTGSPAMHNAGYKALNLNFVYLAFDVLDIGKAIDAMKSLSIVGFSVSLPYKIKVIKYLDEIDPIAQKIGAVNTVVNQNGKLKGYNSDWEGCVKAIKEKTEITGKKVLLIGTGGAGRAVAFGMKKEGGILSLINRHYEKAQKLALELGVSAYHITDLEKIVLDSDIVIQATPVGMFPNSKQSVIPRKYLHKNLLIHDIVYNPLETKLIQNARNSGCEVVLGYKMLLWQAAVQFELFTGQPAPVDAMEKALLSFLIAQ